MDFNIPRPDSRGKLHHKRVEELLVHLAADFIVRESNGTSLITATRAELGQRGERAVIYVTVFPTEATKNALEFLNRNADEFREYMREHARTRELPRAEFVLDEGERIRQRLDELGKGV
jgi:ribosome-binding factor A